MATIEEPPKTEKKMPKTEGIKYRSNYLMDPLREELKNEQIFVSPDAVVVLKYHGSYQQDDRDKRAKGVEKKYQFMLRLKSPAGEIPPELYLKLDELCDQYGQGDLRATTRQAFQLHGIMKGNLGTVITTIQEAGSSTVGACGDVSRNVMCPAAPFNTPAYRYARQYSQVMAELFKPQTTVFTDIWTGEGEEKEKVAKMEYWTKDLHGFNIDGAMRKDNGNGIITDDPKEPLYGAQYLPRKFKIAVTVPGDNSLDLYINDIGLIVIVNDDGSLKGFNVMVGGGMGRTHGKDATFPRIADHVGFVDKDDVMEVCKAILAAQRDHGNREVRPNARMKYLVANLGIEKFTELVETYYGKKFEPWQEIEEFTYNNWLGWHDQGDGKLFLGINIEQGRVRDYERQAMQKGKAAKVKTLLKTIVTKYQLTMVLTASQSVIFKDIKPEDKEAINKLMEYYGVEQEEELDELVKKSIACPAFPLCGLAVAEAERRMPEFQVMIRDLMDTVGLPKADHMIMRMTGCPNGCARPYMAELALVGDGPDMYQLWLGGAPNLTNLAYEYKNKVKWSNMENELEPILFYWKVNRNAGESFGQLCTRVGPEEIARFSSAYNDMRTTTSPF